MERESIGVIHKTAEWMYYDHPLICTFKYEEKNYIGMYLQDSNNAREEVWLMVEADEEQIADPQTLSMKYFYENSLHYYLFELDCILTEVYSIIPTTKEAIQEYVPLDFSTTFI